MSDTTTFDERGNKIVTNYEPNPRTEYEGTARGDSRKKGESRVEQNRRLRDESRAVGSTRSDSRESVNKEKARKKAAHAKIDEDTEKVRSRQRWEEEPKAAPARPVARQSGVRENLGRNVGRYVERNSGMPSWLNMGGSLPPAMRTRGNLPPAYGMQPGALPAWITGAPPVTAPTRRKKQTPPGSGLPEWFRY